MPDSARRRSKKDASGDTKKHIVLVEDETMLSNLIEAKLVENGYAVKVARDGKEGLTLIHAEKPDLVLLDLLLPGLNGFKILETLSEEKLLPELAVVVISNSGQQVEVERALKLGVRDYLIKINFTPHEVLEKVEQVLAGGSPQKISKKSSLEVRSPSSHILIIEDDLILVELLESKFRQHGYRISRAFNVAEARLILKGGDVDLILLDIILPDMDGFMFLSELKRDASFKGIPVMVISNLGQKEEIEKGLKAGAVDYIIKANVLPTEILKKVEAVLTDKK